MSRKNQETVKFWAYLKQKKRWVYLFLNPSICTGFTWEDNINTEKVYSNENFFLFVKEKTTNINNTSLQKKKKKIRIEVVSYPSTKK